MGKTTPKHPYPMTREEILSKAGMPACSPSFPKGPYRFLDREYFVITYETDPTALAHFVPEPLKVCAPYEVHYEWIRMPDSAGFGDYTESGVVIPCELEGQKVSFVSQMFLDDLPPIAAGREIWGFPKEYAKVELETVKETLVGRLGFSGERVATGTMVYKEKELDKEKVKQALGGTQILLKMIPGADGNLDICQLVALELCDITVKGAWEGEARLHLIPHAHAPVADLPIKKIKGAKHFVTDLTLPYGRVVHDYLA